MVVESEGFEPSSKQAIIKLSTSLVDDWFSELSRPSTAYLKLSFLNLGRPQKRWESLPNFDGAFRKQTARQGLLQDILSLYLVEWIKLIHLVN